MIACSPDGQWAAVKRGLEVLVFAGGAGPTAAGPVARIELPTDDADLAMVGPPSVLAVVTRGPTAGGELGHRIVLYQPPSPEPAAHHDLDAAMRIAGQTGSRLVLVSRDGKAVTLVRTAGRALGTQAVDPGSPVEFAVGLERNQVLLSLLRKLETWDAVSGRPLLRMQLPLPAPPRTVGPAHGSLWVTRPGGDDIVVCRLSDGRSFRHVLGVAIDEVIYHPASPLLILVTARGLVRLHCYAHTLTRIEAPWQPGTELGQLVVGEDITLLGLGEHDEEPWRVPIGGSGAPAISLDAPEASGEPMVTAADKLRAMRERSLQEALDRGDRADRPEGADRPDQPRLGRPSGLRLSLSDGSDPVRRFDRGDLFRRSEPADRSEPVDRPEGSDPAGQGDLPERGDPVSRTDRPPDRGDRGDRSEPGDRPEGSDPPRGDGADHGDLFHRDGGPNRGDLFRRGEPADRSEPVGRPEGGDPVRGDDRAGRGDRFPRGELFRSDGSPDRGGPFRRGEPADRSEPIGRPEGSGPIRSDGRPEGSDPARGGDRPDRGDLFSREDRAGRGDRFPRGGPPDRGDLFRGGPPDRGDAVAVRSHALPAMTAWPVEPRGGGWRDPVAAFGVELARRGDAVLPEIPARPDLGELGELADRLALAPGALRALAALYGLYLIGEPVISLARLAHALGDWTEPLGQGELGALAMLRRRGGKIGLRGPVTDLLDGVGPRAIRLIGTAAAVPRPGAARLARDGRSDAAIEAELASQLGRIAVIEGRAALALLEARLHGATAVALVPPLTRPLPWPRDAGLVVIAEPAAPAWVAGLPVLTAA